MMAETRPRDLTAEELARLQAPASAETQNAPLRIPPGTSTAIELLNPAETTATSSPTAVMAEKAGSGSSSAPKSAATGPSPRKR
jgi:hypothetical protein